MQQHIESLKKSIDDMKKIVENRVKYSDDALISHVTNPSEKRAM